MMGKGAERRTLRLLLTGGGTGGHLFPAIATAEQVMSAMPQSSILFVGTRRKLDRDSLARYGFAVATIHSYGLKGKSLLELIKAMLVLPLSFLESIYQVLKFKPDVVMGVGGYVTGPVVAASWLLGKPTLIHEQNSVPGLANRKLGRLVDRICLSLPQSKNYFPAEKTILTGNPVRQNIIAAGRSTSPETGKPTLLVLGGSQGAHAINELVVAVLKKRRDDFAAMRIIHQTGRDDEQTVEQAYRALGLDYRVSAFITNMAEVYAEAGIIVSRAGATTLAEIGVVGKPAILIPYPFAADNHQEKNGSWYVDSGAAVLFVQKELTAERLGDEILAIINDKTRLQQMSAAMKNLGITDAAERIVDICLTLAGK